MKTKVQKVQRLLMLWLAVIAGIALVAISMAGLLFQAIADSQPIPISHSILVIGVVMGLWTTGMAMVLMVDSRNAD